MLLHLDSKLRLSARIRSSTRGHHHITIELVQQLSQDDFYRHVRNRSTQSRRLEGTDAKKSTHSIMVLTSEDRLSDTTMADVDYMRKLVKVDFKLGKHFGGITIISQSIEIPCICLL